ncbi:MAG: hypothetical protein F6K42_33845 [Leptolyngbya sp. SIO1D8]|nr:hypothetical protein [Leptolyngbya sp. SIO1D8]
MHTVTLTGEIQAAADRIWQVWDDYGNIAVFKSNGGALKYHEQSTHGAWR